MRPSPSPTLTNSVSESGPRETDSNPKSLVLVMASWSKTKPSNVERDAMLSLLVESRLFACQVWLLQLGMLALWAYTFTVYWHLTKHELVPRRCYHGSVPLFSGGSDPADSSMESTRQTL